MQQLIVRIRNLTDRSGDARLPLGLQCRENLPNGKLGLGRSAHGHHGRLRDLRDLRRAGHRLARYGNRCQE